MMVNGICTAGKRRGRRKANLLISLSQPQVEVDVDKQGYAQPTLTSRLRVEQSQPKKKEKENILPFIACGSKVKKKCLSLLNVDEFVTLNFGSCHTLEKLATMQFYNPADSLENIIFYKIECI